MVSAICLESSLQDNKKEKISSNRKGLNMVGKVLNGKPTGTVDAGKIFFHCAAHHCNQILKGQ